VYRRLCSYTLHCIVLYARNSLRYIVLPMYLIFCYRRLCSYTLHCIVLYARNSLRYIVLPMYLIFCRGLNLDWKKNVRYSGKMKIGIVGMPNVGKSTLFQALTKKHVDTSNYPFATIDPNVGVVSVPDERLRKLSELSRSARVIPAIVEFVDIAGLVKGAAEGEGLGNQFLTHIREVDAICHVIRAFENENIVHVAGAPDPSRDFEIIQTELALKDLETVTKAKEKAAKEAKTGKKEALECLGAIKTIEQILASSTPTAGSKNSLTLNFALQNKDNIVTIAQQYQLLSFKPTMVVFNISASSKNTDYSLQTIHYSLALDVAQEDAIAALSLEEQKELGVESKLSGLIQGAYELLGLITFFTTGEGGSRERASETRAWTIPRSSTAKRAGRAIHSDFEEKFIRADVIFWEKLLKATSWSKARDLGWLRSEGKEYIVQDGDVMEFKI